MAPIGLKLCQNAFQTICNFRFFDAQKTFSTPKKFVLRHFSVSERRFSSILVYFGGARRFLTSKSDSLTNFAPGTQLLRSVRLLELGSYNSSYVMLPFENLFIQGQKLFIQTQILLLLELLLELLVLLHVFTI